MNTQKGNVLFLILIAVALFAALSYAVTSSTRNSGGDITKEKTALAIGGIEDLASHLSMTLMRKRISENIQEYEMNYEDKFSNSAHNYACVTLACDLFNAAGGGVSNGFSLPAEFVGTAGYGGKFWFRNLSVKSLGDSNQRDFFLLFPDVSKDFCIAYNNHAGVTNPGGIPPIDDHIDNSHYVDYTSTISSQVVLTDAPVHGETAGSPVEGKANFCVYNILSYHLYAALLIR